VPVLGVSSPAKIDKSVLLPEPDAPTIATVCWGSSSKFTS
jgi:hypothetical protein